MSLRYSDLFTDPVKFNHPKVLFPLYYGFELALLGTAFICAAAGVRPAAAGNIRRFVLLALVGVSCAVALVDYTVVYRELAQLMADHEAMPAPQFAARHQASRRLNEALLALSIAATIAAHWPAEEERGTSRDRSRPDVL
jgi:hypothetical protein